MSTTNIDRHPGHKKWLLKHSVRYKKLTFVYVMCLLLFAAAASYIPVVIGEVIDKVISSQSSSEINKSLLLLLSLSIGSFLVFISFNSLASLWAYKNEKNIRNELFDSIQAKPVEFHSTTTSGDIMALTTNDINAISGLFIQSTNLISNSSSMIFFHSHIPLTTASLPLFPCRIGNITL